jgi:hypothetical protein
VGQGSVRLWPGERIARRATLPLAGEPRGEQSGRDEDECSFVWEVAPGETLLLSKDKCLLVPEPSAVAGMGLGLRGVGWVGRLQRA